MVQGEGRDNQDEDHFGRGFVGLTEDGVELPARKDDFGSAIHAFKSEREDDPLAAAVAFRACIVQNRLYGLYGHVNADDETGKGGK